MTGVDPGETVHVRAGAEPGSRGVPGPGERPGGVAVEVRVVGGSGHSWRVAVAEGREVEVRGHRQGRTELVGPGVVAAQGRPLLVVDVGRRGVDGTLGGGTQVAGRRGDGVGGGSPPGGSRPAGRVEPRSRPGSRRRRRASGARWRTGPTRRTARRPAGPRPSWSGSWCTGAHPRSAGSPSWSARAGPCCRPCRGPSGRSACASPARPMPVTVVPARVPARLSQRMLLNRSGSLNVGDPPGRVACSWALLPEVETSGRCRLAVGRDRGGRRQVLHDRVVDDPHVRRVVEAMPPPSWVETLLAMTLLSTFIWSVPPAPGHQEPDAAAVVVGEVGLDLVGVDVDRTASPATARRGSAGSSPAIMMPPPSSLDVLK